MSSDTLRVYPVDGEGYGAPTVYPHGARYRMEPHYPGAAGDKNHDIVVYRLDEKSNEVELGRHDLNEHMVAFAGQPVPPAATEADANYPGHVNTDRTPAKKAAKSSSSTASSSK